MSAPIKNTCPDIDDIQARIAKAIQVMTDIDREVDLHFTLSVNEEISDLEGCNSDLEDLRTANATLRSYGEDMEEQKEHFENEYATAISDIEELQQRIDDLKSQHEDEIEERDALVAKLRERITELEGADTKALRKLIF